MIYRLPRKVKTRKYSYHLVDNQPCWLHGQNRMYDSLVYEAATLTEDGELAYHTFDLPRPDTRYYTPAGEVYLS